MKSQLSVDIIECLKYVRRRHPIIAKPGAEWYDLHAGNGMVLHTLILDLLEWHPYVHHVETNRLHHGRHGIDHITRLGRCKYVPYKAEYPRLQYYISLLNSH